MLITAIKSKRRVRLSNSSFGFVDLLNMYIAEASYYEKRVNSLRDMYSDSSNVCACACGVNVVCVTREASIFHVPINCLLITCVYCISHDSECTICAQGVIYKTWWPHQNDSPYDIRLYTNNNNTCEVYYY